MIDQNTIDLILSKTSITDVIGDFVHLKQRGQNSWSVCPFHDEKTASFSVNESMGIYKCFGCGKSGSVVGFVMEHEHMSYPEAMEYLGKRVGVDVCSNHEKRFDLALVQHVYVKNNARAIAYMKSRGFSQQTCDDIGIGYAPGGNYLSKNARDKDILYKNGVIGKNSTGYYDRFSDRITFPIHGITGKIIGWTARSQNYQPKYINSPQTDVYDKSRALFNIYSAKKAIVKDGRCYIVEGPTDAMRMIQDQGIENVVATCGTALTKEQCRMIGRFTDNVVIVYDGDVAGERATVKAIETLLTENMNPSVFRVPDGKDPGGYFVEKRDINDVGWLDYYVDGCDLIDPVHTSMVAKDVMNMIRMIPDDIKQLLYTRRLSQILRVPEESLGGKIVVKESTQTSTDEPSSMVLHERYIVWLLMVYGEDAITIDGGQVSVRDFIVSDFSQDEIVLTDPVCLQIYKEYEDGCPKFSRFLGHESVDVSKLASEMMSGDYYNKSLSGAGLVKDITHAMLSLKSLIVDRSRSRLHQMMRDAQDRGDMTGCMELMKKEGEVAQMYRRINQELGRVVCR